MIMSSNKKTIEKNKIKQDGETKYFQPIVGCGFCYLTMKSNNNSIKQTAHDWAVKKAEMRK